MKRWDPTDVIIFALVFCVFCLPMLAASVAVIIAAIRGGS